MISNEFGLRLDISKLGEARRRSPRQTVVTRVGDVDSTTILATIVNGDEAVDLTGYSARLEVAKADGTWYQQGCEVDAEASTARATLASQAVAAQGRSSLAYIALYQGASWICSTEDFVIEVLGAVDHEGYESSDYSDVLLSDLANVEAATQSATDAAKGANDSAAYANQATASANAAAQAAQEAADEARGAVAPELSLYLAWMEDEDGDMILGVVNASEE